MPVQLGGGIRDLDTIERYLDDGVRYVIIGTAAVKNPGFLHEACDAFPGHVMVGLDAKDGKVAVEGWSKLTGHDVVDLAKRFEGYGVEAIIYTDIGRDGMLTGVNIEATQSSWPRRCRFPVIASGGVTNLDDVQRAVHRRQATASSARSPAARIYQGTLDFAEAQKLADELAGGVFGSLTCSSSQTHHPLPRRHRRPRGQGRQLRRAARRRRSGRDRRRYDEQGADELTFLDITASQRQPRH